ncbi:MAG TPA: D-alanyl-D-alanine carboxypeptidase, partial [Blastocatellia bacterium]
DGTHTVTVTGSFPSGQAPILFKYAVPSPSRFAQILLVEALRELGIKVSMEPGRLPAEKSRNSCYAVENTVAEHVSPPLKEEVKVTLKVSQNLHASATPFIMGALLGKRNERNGFDVEHDFLARAGLDLSGAAQSDGAGGAAYFTPEFMVSFLAYMYKQKNYEDFLKALPILGRDGTLWNIQPKSPAAGHVFAKTGTFAEGDLLNKRTIVTGKGLAGYLTTSDGGHLAFAIYVNKVSVPEDPDAITRIAGQALGEIAAAAYEGM